MGRAVPTKCLWPSPQPHRKAVTAVSFPTLQRQPVRVRVRTSRGRCTPGCGAEPAGEARLNASPETWCPASWGHRLLGKSLEPAQRHPRPACSGRSEQGRDHGRGTDAQRTRSHPASADERAGSDAGSRDSEGEPCWRGPQPGLLSLCPCGALPEGSQGGPRISHGPCRWADHFSGHIWQHR